MGRPAEKWPTYALENLEASVDRLKELERMARQVQTSIVAGDTPAALLDLSDVRVMALECVDDLVRARIGKYKQQEASRWKKPKEEQATAAVARVVATRRP